MSKTVWKMLPVEPFDMRGLEEWLSAMAAKGLHLAYIGEYTARFQPGTPQEGVRYALDVKDWADIDPERNALYEQAGWEYVNTLRGLYYVYRTQDPDAPALHTDPVTQSFTFDRLLRRLRWSPLAFIAMILIWNRKVLFDLFAAPWSVLEAFLLDTTGTCLLLVLYSCYILLLANIIRRQHALKALQKQLADGIPLEEIHRRPLRAPWVLTEWGPFIFVFCATLIFGFYIQPRLFQQLPGPESWDFPHVALEQVLDAELTPESPYDAQLHPPTLSRSFLVPEQIYWTQQGFADLENGESEKCAITINLYRLRFPDMAPLLLRCVQEKELAWWRTYEKNTGKLYINPDLVELQSFRPVETSAFDELTVLTFRTADMETSQDLYVGRLDDLVFTLTCSAPADTSRVLDIFTEEVLS